MEKITKFFFVGMFILPGIIIAQAPVANFSASDTTICFAGGNDSVGINFTDLSTNSPTSWKWYFSGATPDTSTMENPTNIYYSGAGCYTVKLVVSNSSGSDSLTDSNYVCLYYPPVVIFTGQNEICQGSVDTISVSPSYSYHWSTGATTSSIMVTPFASITYTIQVRNGQCFKDTTFTVIVDTPAHIRVSGDTAICTGNSTVIYVSGGNTYLWNTGSTVDSLYTNSISHNVTYCVNVTKGVCVQDTVCITVKVYPPPIPVVSPVDTTVCQFDSVLLIATGGNYYIWSPGSSGLNHYLFYGDTDKNDAAPTVTTIYTVNVCTWGCCSDTSIEIHVDTCSLGVPEISELPEFVILPNPANSFIVISFQNPNNETAVLSVGDILGRELFIQKVNPNQSQMNLDVTFLASGIYFLKLQSDGATVVRKFIKE